MQNTEKENKKAMIRKKSKKTKEKKEKEPPIISCTLSCLLYTSDAADE